MNDRILTLLLLITISVKLSADDIKGRLLDSKKSPIGGVAVIMQTTDSVFVDAVVSNDEGYFIFNQPFDSYILHFQHIQFDSFSILIKDNNVGDIFLKEKDNTLNEVTITATRPQVKVENGALIFDMSQIIKNKPITNAFDVIKELPGVMGTDDSINLIGVNSVGIVINGQVTSMSISQLINMLKTIPVSRIQHAEVMYNPPARYNAKGALINVVIQQKKEDGDLFQGEIGAEIRQYHYTRGNAHANLLYSTPNFTADLIVNGDLGKRYGGEDLYSKHILNEQIHEIKQNNRVKSDNTKGSVRLGLEYNFKNKDLLSFSYYVDASDYDSKRNSNTFFDNLSNKIQHRDLSNIKTVGDNVLQNAQLQFKNHNGFIIGAELLKYKGPEIQIFNNNSYYDEDIVESSTISTDSKQDIIKLNGFISKSFSLKNKLNISFGSNVVYSKAKTEVGYDYFDNNELNENNNNEQKEIEAGVFGEASRGFGRFNMKISLKGEYFRSQHITVTEKTDTWKEWGLFPNATLSYRHSPSKIWQFNVTSNKRYPSYWAINPQITYLNAYSIAIGNPQLKPSQSYNFQLMYIFKQKYIFMAYCNYEPDRIMQLPYQSKNELKNVFRYENFDHRLLSGIGIIAPIKLGTFFNSRVIMQGMCVQDKKDDFYDISIDNKKIFGRIDINSTITLSAKKPNLQWTVSGYYVTSAIQGIYDLSDYYDVSTGLKWQLSNNKGSVILKYNNIFKSNMPSPNKINIGNQFSRLTTIDSTSYVGLSFSWNFGKFKPKVYKNVDDSRFGR